MTACKTLSPFGLLIAGLAFFSAAYAQAPQAPSDVTPRPGVGRIERIAQFPSHYVQARNVDVWMPPGYDPTVRYPVLYMQDGQMLFDAAITWNHQAWHVDEVLAKLIGEGKVPPAIVVGVANLAEARAAEFFPEKALDAVSQPARDDYIRRQLAGRALGDAYLKFVVTELKPYIDLHFPTLADRAHTFIAGSSMGGAISVYALCEYPNVFGGAAALSTYWGASFEGNDHIPLAVFGYLDTHLPTPGDHRLYMDRGTLGLDAEFAANQAIVDQIATDHGYGRGNLFTKTYAGATHDEDSWHARLAAPLLFLLAGKAE
ncbi:MAG: esterase family protein [Alphaproteobacteria bacterium]|nr:esterase family protein [Alphaproteobacteria bacterium]